VSDPQGLYDDASVYDILHAPDTAWEVDGLERTFERFVSTRSRDPLFLEPACGSGRYLRVLCGRGRRVAGFDIDDGMVAYASRGLEKFDASRWRIFSAGMVGFAQHMGRDRADLAFNPINTIRHLESDEQMLAHFEEMAGVLRTGGVYAVGISLTAYGLEAPSEDVWTGTRGRCTVTQRVQYDPQERRREAVYSHLTIERPSGVEERSSSYVLRRYDRAEWDRLIERSALRLIASVDERGDEIGERAMGYGVDLLTTR